jgi:hypothetical protein
VAVRQEIRRFLSEIGTKGGKAGTGDAKKRGDSDHYRKMIQKRWSKKK